MTEEEKKKQKQQAATQQPDAVEQSIRNMEGRAAELRTYAQSPVNIDTSGQPNWMQEIERVRREYTESPEQQAAREQREKRNRRIAAISDGLVALSNVAGAMAGATPIKQTTTMSDAHREAVERAAKRRRENATRYETARRYLSGLQQQQDKLNADRYQKEAKARQDAGKQADDLTYQATRLAMDRDRAAEQARHNRTVEDTARMRAVKSGNSRTSGSGKNRYTLTIEGKTYTYPSAADYNRAVYNYAQQYGVKTQEDRGNGIDSYRKTEDIASEVERKAKSNYGSALKKRNSGGSALKNRN